MFFNVGFMISAFLTQSAYLLCRYFIGDRQWVNRKVFFIIGVCLGFVSIAAWAVHFTLMGQLDFFFGFYGVLAKATSIALLITGAFYFLSGYLKNGFIGKLVTISSFIAIVWINIIFLNSLIDTYRYLSSPASCGQDLRGSAHNYIVLNIKKPAC